MNREILTSDLNAHANAVWSTLCELRPALVKFDVPTIKINGRLYRTAGRCFQDLRKVELGFKFFCHSKAFSRQMYNIILPHELIHQADFDLHGDSEKNCGHGENWCKLMLEYGIPANKFHDMWLDV